MSAKEVFLIGHDSPRFTYDDANRVASCALREAGTPTVVVDLAHTTETTTAALARLVGLRGWLLRHGRDLRMRGPGGPAKGLYEISRLERALPQDHAQLA